MRVVPSKVFYAKLFIVFRWLSRVPREPRPARFVADFYYLFVNILRTAGAAPVMHGRVFILSPSVSYNPRRGRILSALPRSGGVEHFRAVTQYTSTTFSFSQPVHPRPRRGICPGELAPAVLGEKEAGPCSRMLSVTGSPLKNTVLLPFIIRSLSAGLATRFTSEPCVKASCTTPKTRFKSSDISIGRAHISKSVYISGGTVDSSSGKPNINDGVLT